MSRTNKMPSRLPTLGKTRLRRFVRRLFRALGYDVVRHPAENETLKAKCASLEDQLRVQRHYFETLHSVANAVQGEPGKPSTYPSCRWIEGGLSFIPGHLRVCPNTHLQGGTPGLAPFTNGRIPTDDILACREVIRYANRLGVFGPCKRCAFLVEQAWTPRKYAFDLLCIAHATACNLACYYCHSFPEERYRQNPDSVPRLYSSIAALIEDGLLAPASRVQWGGGEPTILREFDALFTLLKGHGAYSEVYTSGVRIPRVLLDAVAEDCAGVMISLDAGCSETYARIKGRPLFDRVVANAARYAKANPGRTLLKMIISERNLHEVTQFLDISARNGIRIVCYDTMMYSETTSDAILDASARFREEAEKRGLECRIGEVGSVFNPDERVAEQIERRVRV